MNKPLPTSLEASTTREENAACVLVSHEVAETYAQWAGKRLPTESEWEAAVDALGPERLGMGEVWEWTSTRHDVGSHVEVVGAINSRSPQSRKIVPSRRVVDDSVISTLAT